MPFILLKWTLYGFFVVKNNHDRIRDCASLDENALLDRCHFTVAETVQ